MEFDIDNLDMLSGADQLRELSRQKQIFESALNKASIDAYSTLAREADIKNPNREKHKLTYDDIQAIVTNVARYGLVRNVVNKKGEAPLLTVKLAVDEFVRSNNKHSDWAAEVKHRVNYGYSVKSSIRELTLVDEEVKHFFQGIDLNIINDSATMNKALTKLVEEHEKVINMAYLIQEDKLKAEQIISLEERVAQTEKEIDELKAGVIVKQRNDWKIEALILKFNGYKYADIASTVGVGIDSVKQYMRKPEAKRELERLKSKSGI